MSALKIKLDKSIDNVDTKKLNPIFKEWIESLDMPWNDGRTEIQPLEYISRDGFSAHDHNRGGMDLFNVTSIRVLIGSGEHFGLAIEDYVTDLDNENYKYIKENNPTLNDEQINDLLWESNSEYDDVAYRVRVMYNGNNEVSIFIGYDTDAPYFRWSDKELQEIVIKFKNKTDLKKKLKKLKVKT